MDRTAIREITLNYHDSDVDLRQGLRLYVDFRIRDQVAVRTARHATWPQHGQVIAHTSEQAGFQAAIWRGRRRNLRQVGSR